VLSQWYPFFGSTRWIQFNHFLIFIVLSQLNPFLKAPLNSIQLFFYYLVFNIKIVLSRRYPFLGAPVEFNSISSILLILFFYHLSTIQKNGIPYYLFFVIEKKVFFCGYVSPFICGIRSITLDWNSVFGWNHIKWYIRGIFIGFWS